MSKAFVFLNCEQGTEKSIMTQMKNIFGVSRASGLSGVYDIVVEVDTESTTGISRVVKKFRSIDNIRSCLTMFVADYHGDSAKVLAR